MKFCNRINEHETTIVTIVAFFCQKLYNLKVSLQQKCDFEEKLVVVQNLSYNFAIVDILHW